MLSLVTGASSGIGDAIARDLARRGSDLLLVARSGDRLQALADELTKSQRIKAQICPVDLTAPGAVTSVVAAIRAMGRLDVLVNNAGFATFGPFADLKLETEIEEIRLNVLALTELTKRLLPDLLAVRGKILNIGSTAAFQPGPFMAVYYATKAYVLSFSEALSYELRPAGVQVTCLCPGPTRSGFEARAGVGGTRLFTVGLMSAEAVARAGTDGLFKGRRLVVPGFLNRVGVWMVRFSPRGTVLAVIHWLHGRGGRP